MEAFVQGTFAEFVSFEEDAVLYYDFVFALVMALYC